MASKFEGPPGEVKDALRDRESYIEELEVERAELRQEVSSLEPHADRARSLENDVQEYELEVDKLRCDNRALRKRVGALEAQLSGKHPRT